MDFSLDNNSKNSLTDFEVHIMNIVWYEYVSLNKFSQLSIDVPVSF
jgi:hypothetical protein